MTRQEIRVDGDGATLVGSYSAAGSTAVIAVHGAEQGCRGWYLYEHLHDVLPAAGIGVLTFDRRGEGVGRSGRGGTLPPDLRPRARGVHRGHTG